MPALLRSGGALHKERVEWTKGPVAVELADVQVLHGGFNALVPQQFFKRDDVEPIFEQMGSIGMPQGVCRDVFADASGFGHRFDDPIDAAAAVTAIKIATSPALVTPGLAMEEPVSRFFGGNVLLQTADDVVGKRHIAVLFSFTLHNVQHLAVEVEFAQADVAHFNAAQTAAIHESQQDFVLEQGGLGEQLPHFLFAEHYGQLFFVFDARQVQEGIIEAFAFEQEPKAVNGMLEIGLGGCFATRLQQVEVILYLLGIEFGRQAIEMHGHGRNVARVAIEGACAASQNADIALKTLQKLVETRHLLAGAVQELVRTKFSRWFFLT